jgi:hypothetical protein
MDATDREARILEMVGQLALGVERMIEVNETTFALLTDALAGVVMVCQAQQERIDVLSELVRRHSDTQSTH